MNVKLTKLWVDLNVLFTKLTSTLLFIYFGFYRLLALKLDPLLFQTSNYTQNFESTQSNLNSCGTLSHKNLNPWLVTGLVDAEGSFSLGLYKNNKYKTGYQVQLIFKITLHNKDIDLLNQLLDYYGVGNIKKHGETTLEYYVKSYKDLKVIIAHFDKYPLITQKQADCLLFKQALDILSAKEHLTVEGLRKIVGVRASMNLGLPEELKTTFPYVISALRPIVSDICIKDPHWVAGFTSGDGSFIVSIFSRGSDSKPGVRLMFKITQHSRDAVLLTSLIDYLGCGRYEPRSGKEHGEFIVSNLPDIVEKIIPFFESHFIGGMKSLDFLAFKQVASLMQYKQHLTSEGLSKIKDIKSKMNALRVIKQ